MSEQQPTSRRAEPIISELEVYSEYRKCDRWAIIVGISRYRYQGWNLRYADRDAEELYNLLLTPSGGNFKKEFICKLINEEATTANITRALRAFLKKPAREDLVVIYFACHGTPDFDRPGNIYLLTHDTAPGDIAGTALPMREIDLSLRENLLAEKVIVLADTCHSAAIAGGIGRRSAVDDSTFVNRYLQEVSKARGGIALLTSAEANEVSFEDARWGGGHGVFTHYLLEGMRGAADGDKNGIVTVGELFEYVRDNVKRATDHRQHPLIGANVYDRSMPVSMVPSTELSNILRNEQQPYTEFHLKDEAKERQPKNVKLPKWQLIGVGLVCVVIVITIVYPILTNVDRPPQVIPTQTYVEPQILKDYEIRIYFIKDRPDVETRANKIKELFSKNFGDKNIFLLPQEQDFFDKYTFPNPDINTPVNEIRYTSKNEEAAKYLEKILQNKLPSEQFDLLPIGSASGKYVSIFIRP
ncbi:MULTISPECIES: caspase family protein [unclassified Microcoleus]|uniref:caspase family protein n=1 Tax=unclassified Microcoleus TaxID=2642155 RepID=UPI002FD248BA